MSSKYYKGDNLVAMNTDTNISYNFTCPNDGMCSKMLVRYLVMQLDKPSGSYIFIKQ